MLLPHRKNLFRPTTLGPRPVPARRPSFPSSVAQLVAAGTLAVPRGPPLGERLVDDRVEPVLALGPQLHLALRLLLAPGLPLGLRDPLVQLRLPLGLLLLEPQEAILARRGLVRPDTVADDERPFPAVEGQPGGQLLAGLLRVPSISRMYGRNFGTPLSSWSGPSRIASSAASRAASSASRKRPYSSLASSLSARDARRPRDPRAAPPPPRPRPGRAGPSGRGRPARGPDTSTRGPTPRP